MSYDKCWSAYSYNKDGEFVDVSDDSANKGAAFAMAEEALEDNNPSVSYVEVIEHTPVMRFERSDKVVRTVLN